MTKMMDEIESYLQDVAYVSTAKKPVNENLFGTHS
jgi:hypothetical protein